MDNPGAIVGLIIGFTFVVLAIGTTTYVVVRRRRRLANRMWSSSPEDIGRTLNLGKRQLLDEPHSFSSCYNSESPNNNFRHLPSPNKSADRVEFVSRTPNHAIKGLGKLQFSVTYDNTHQELQVSVLRCMDLPNLDHTLNTIDSYVKLELLPEKRHRVKTRVVRGSSDPYFGEAFTMSKVPLIQLKAGSLHFKIFALDQHSRDSLIGEVICPLSELDLNLSKEVTTTREILKRKFSASDKNRGLLLISLCYLPAACRLTAVVLKAEGLPKVDLAESPGNPYVKLYFLENNRRIAKKKTHVKKRTSNPVFNEAFALDIPPNAKLEDIKLDFRVVNWERDSPSKVIGHVILGYSGNDRARQHWKTAIENPRKQVAEWHNMLA
nr:synaptotagmin [Hymenolepis microstoma]